MILLQLLLSLTLLSQSLSAVIPRDGQRILNPTADDLKKIFTFANDFPPPNSGNLQVHDPNIIEEKDTLYLFKGGIHIPYWKASSISGPWTQVGTVLSKASVINKKNNNRPWAPTVTKYKGTFYCFYAISQSGSQDSAIGYASTSDLEKEWTDHGALINTGSGEGSQLAPYKNTNAIDPAFQVDQKSGQPYLIYGSYWDDIYSLPLQVDKDGKLSVKDENKPDATHLSYMPGNWRPQEGSYMSYHEPYYYLWFSQGICCQMVNKGFPLKGEEYRIRVGRSKSITGPFVDKSGKKLLDGYGEKIYGSNNGNVYAPGGVGVLPGNGQRGDILYHHFFNGSIGFKESDTQLGWHYLEYKDGWPVVKTQDPPVKVPEPMKFALPSVTYMVETGKRS